MASFVCIDAHTCGNPVRVVKEGKPALKGATMFERRQYFLEHHDWIRKGLMFEPRGHDMMSGSMIYPPMDPAHDCSVLFIETSGCLPMCGHGLIGTITVGIEQNLIEPKTAGEVWVETPAGIIKATYQQQDDKVTSVRITNVPSFLAETGVSINSPLGMIQVDIAYGGNFYAIVDPQPNYQDMDLYSASELIAMSRTIREAINKKQVIKHPENDQISGVSHVLWTGIPKLDSSTARNAVFYGDKAIDRSPCGTGTSARMAQWYAQGRLKPGESFIHESIIGSQFVGRIEDVTEIENHSAIVPSVEGWARIIGFNTWLIEDDCPFREGFQVI